MYQRYVSAMYSISFLYLIYKLYLSLIFRISSYHSLYKQIVTVFMAIFGDLCISHVSERHLPYTKIAETLMGDTGFEPVTSSV